jgi:hypothetical protein
MHLAPKQILVNAHINFKDRMINEENVTAIAAIEEKVKQTVPKVAMIFPETLGLRDTGIMPVNPKHTG